MATPLSLDDLDKLATSSGPAPASAGGGNLSLDDLDKLAAGDKPQHERVLDVIGGFLRGAGGNIPDAASGIMHPIQSLHNMWNAQMGQYQQAKEDFSKGDYLHSYEHAAGGTVPVVGPSIAEFLVNLDKQNPPSAEEMAHSLGQIVGAKALMDYGPQAVSKVAELAKKGTSGAATAALKADPAKDLINAYGITDPRAPERLPQAVADLAHDSGTPIESNEHLATTSPKYDNAARKAFDTNRAVWQKWMAQAGDKTINPDSIMQAAEESLKDFGDKEAKQRVMHDLEAKLHEEPLTGSRLEAINAQINAELQSNGFYSKDPAAQNAARNAGALTGRSQAFLESVGQKARNELYNMLDPEGEGAGPREVQRRYGGMKVLTNEATSARSPIYAETAGSFANKVDKAAGAISSLMSKGPKGEVTGPLEALRSAFEGKTNPVIKRAFSNAPEYSPLPEPGGGTPAAATPTARPLTVAAKAVQSMPAPVRTTAIMAAKGIQQSVGGGYVRRLPDGTTQPLSSRDVSTLVNQPLTVAELAKLANK